MTGTLNLGDNYTVEEDSNGDLVITDGDGTAVLSHDDSTDTWTLADATKINDLTDASSGATIYDTSTETLGDGTQSGDFTSATINGKVGVGVPSTSGSASASFGTWAQASTSRPAILTVSVRVETDGSSRGEVVVDVDESGGTTADYSYTVGFADSAAGAGVASIETGVVVLPVGAAYQLRNVSDPNAVNSIEDAREFIL